MSDISRPSLQEAVLYLMMMIINAKEEYLTLMKYTLDATARTSDSEDHNHLQIWTISAFKELIFAVILYLTGFPS